MHNEVWGCAETLPQTAPFVDITFKHGLKIGRGGGVWLRDLRAYLTVNFLFQG